ncbi:hypothetical protein KKH43_01865 [Patescibacteria group bacterium]|nr:hypothetical protein [Patescibacteria group bacterium]
MKILIFTEGTIIIHQSALGCDREDVDKQVKNEDPSVHDFKNYIPVNNAPDKIKAWHDQGVQIIYLTSRKKQNEVRQIENVLKKHGFPSGKLLKREGKEKYKDVAEKIMPDIIIEDDCESIGGINEVTFTHISPKKRVKIKSIPIQEFDGIDHLPNSISKLKQYSTTG